MQCEKCNKELDYTDIRWRISNNVSDMAMRGVLFAIIDKMEKLEVKCDPCNAGGRAGRGYPPLN